MKYGTLPHEPPVQRSLDFLAPKFRDAVQATLDELGPNDYPFETLRTEARQAFLFGFGRDYDDGRGVVTRAPTALLSWHGFGLGADVVEKDNTPWEAPPSFWNQLGLVAEKYGLVWGGRWRNPDLPHLQWGKCPTSPTGADRLLMKRGGYVAVWSKYGAA